MSSWQKSYRWWQTSTIASRQGGRSFESSCSSVLGPTHMNYDLGQELRAAVAPDRAAVGQGSVIGPPCTYPEGAITSQYTYT